MTLEKPSSVRLDSLNVGDQFRWSDVRFELRSKEPVDTSEGPRLKVVYRQDAGRPDEHGNPPYRFGSRGLMAPEELVEPIVDLATRLAQAEARVRELEAENGRIILALLESGVETVKAPLANAVRDALKAAAADSSAALAKAREALEAYEAARSGSIDEHDAFVELRAALATQTPAEQDGRVAAVRRVADGPHPDTITVISDDHDHYYVPASALVDAQERIAELEALAGQAAANLYKTQPGWREPYRPSECPGCTMQTGDGSLCSRCAARKADAP